MEQEEAHYVKEAGEDESDDSTERTDRAETRETKLLPVALYNNPSYPLFSLNFTLKE